MEYAFLLHNRTIFGKFSETLVHGKDMEGPYYRPTVLTPADRANQIWLARQVGSSTVLACLICLDTK